MAGQDKFTLAMIESEAKCGAAGLKKVQCLGNDFHSPGYDTVFKVENGHVEGFSVVGGEFAKLLDDGMDG